MPIRPSDQEDRTASGQVLHDAAQEKPQPGRMLADGDEGSFKLKPLGKVLFAKYRGTEFWVDGGDDLLLETGDVRARLN